MYRKQLFTLVVWLLASTALVGADQKAKILLIGKDLDHARNTHTYMSDCELLARCLSQTKGVETVVSNGWPRDPAVVKDVTAIVLHNRLGGRHGHLWSFDASEWQRHPEFSNIEIWFVQRAAEVYGLRKRRVTKIDWSNKGIALEKQPKPL